MISVDVRKRRIEQAINEGILMRIETKNPIRLRLRKLEMGFLKHIRRMSSRRTYYK